MIQFPPFRAEADTGRAPIQSGPGYSLWPHAPGGPVLNVRRWTTECEQVVRETGISRVSIEPEWGEPTLDALLPAISSIVELQLRSPAMRDLSALERLSALEVLRVIEGCELVPFGRLAPLRRCYISDTTLGAVHESPELTHLTLAQMKRVSLESLGALPTLRHLHVVGITGSLRLDGIERLALDHLDLRQVRGLTSLRPMMAQPLEHLHLEDVPRATGVEELGQLHSLRTLHLENVAEARNLDFIGTLTELQALHLADLRLEGVDTTIAPLLALARLCELTLVGSEKGMRSTVDLERLSELPEIEVLRLRDVRKDIASLKWMRDMRKLRVFELNGTRIGDGDLAPLLESMSLEQVTINPTHASYFHTDASFNAAMQVSLSSRQRAVGA